MGIAFFEIIKNNFAEVLYWFEWLYIILIMLLCIITISDNKPPTKTLSWVLFLVFVPVIGIIFYFFFGQNYRKKKLFYNKEANDFRKINELTFSHLKSLSLPNIKDHKDIWKKLHIIKLLFNNSKSILTINNQIDIFNLGEDKFRALKKDLLEAKHHIHMEYYIFQDDIVGNEIFNILIEKAKQGIEVRIIFDDVGSWHLSKNKIRQLRKHGIQIESFLKVKFPLLTSKINYRNHRKIVVIDGKIGYVGGMNIAKHYVFGTQRLGKWRDTHLRIYGEAVHSLQIVFITDWYFITNKLPSNNKYFPKSTINNTCLIQIATSGPDTNWAGIMQTYFYSISTARKSICLTTPYLLPNSAILTALKTASLSGVDIKLIIPTKSDSKIVYYASLSYVKELLRAGIKIYLYNDGFIHSKVVIIDNIFSSVGTANMDYRSFSLNFEVNAIVYSKEIALELTSQFNIDLLNSNQINLYQWNNRSKLDKFKSNFARIFSPLM